MTAEDNEPRDEESTETEGSDHESADDEGTESTEGDDRSVDEDFEDSDDEDDDDRSEDRVKEHDEYDDETPGVTDARPGRDDIGESQMPSDYHRAVADRPIEVNLPDTPDLSEDAASGGSASSGTDD